VTGFMLVRREKNVYVLGRRLYGVVVRRKRNAYGKIIEILNKIL